MTVSIFGDRVQMTVSGTPGTGTITFGSAVAGYQTPAQAGISTGSPVSYIADDVSNVWEVGQGTYTLSGLTLTRGPTSSSSGGAAVSLSSSAIIKIGALSADLNALRIGSAIVPTSWTPVLKFGGGTTGITYSAQSGSYVKFGQMVIATCRITLTSKGSSTGVATITGWPGGAASALTSGNCGFYTGMSSIVSLIGYLDGIAFNLANAGAVSVGSITDTNFTNSSDLSISVAYPSNS